MRDAGDAGDSGDSCDAGDSGESRDAGAAGDAGDPGDSCDAADAVDAGEGVIKQHSGINQTSPGLKKQGCEMEKQKIATKRIMPKCG